MKLDKQQAKQIVEKYLLDSKTKDGKHKRIRCIVCRKNITDLILRGAVPCIYGYCSFIHANLGNIVKDLEAKGIEWSFDGHNIIYSK